MKVTVVLDRAYGRGDHQPLGPAFWLIESVENRALADRLRKTQACDPNSAVFQWAHHATVGEAVVSIFFNVIEHHPAWTEIEFVGAALDAEVRGAFDNEGVRLTATPLGFLVSATQSSDAKAGA